MITFKKFINEAKAKDMTALEIKDMVKKVYPNDNEEELKAKFREVYSHITALPNMVLNKKALKKILNEGKIPKDSIIIDDIVQALFDMYGKKVNNETGAKYAKSILGDFLRDLKYSGEGYGPYFDDNIYDWISNF